MGPRKYRMRSRAAGVEETRRRIIDATLALHAEKGIFGTTWRDIAQAADVAVATVYKHFPTLEELVPACGAVVQSLANPPSPEDAPEIFADARSAGDRLARLVTAFYDAYERGEPYLEIDARERQMPLVQEWEAEMRAVRETLVREALDGTGAPEASVRAIAAVLDFPLYKSLRRHDVSRQRAEDVVQVMLRRLLPVEGGTVA